MEGIFVIVTRNEDLFSAWRAQLPPDQLCGLELSEALDSERGIARVVIVDAMCWREVECSLKENIVVCVGQVHSRAFEEAKCDARVRLVLGYEDSRLQLRQFAPILCELAERYTKQVILRGCAAHVQPASPPLEIGAQLEMSAPDLNEFFEELIEDMRSRERITIEFRRIARRMMKASFVEFMIRHGSTIRSDVRNIAIATDDPLVTYLSKHPIVLDGNRWRGPSEPIAELSARNYLALWGARLCIPINNNGLIYGLIVCGLKEDGQTYSSYDLSNLYTIGRMFRKVMTICQKLEEGASCKERMALLSKCNPNVLLLLGGDSAPRATPLAVRALIGQCKRERNSRKAYPTEEQPLRISVAYLPDVEGVWAEWEDCGREIADRAKVGREERKNILRDIALTLNHEIGNSLTSLLSLSQNTLSQGTPNAFQNAYISDVNRLRRLNDDLSQLASILEELPELVDMRHILEELRERNRSVHFEIGEKPIHLNVVRRLLVFALDEILSGVLINRGKIVIDDSISIRLRGVGREASEVALISIRGRDMELEGVLPERGPNSTPSHGRIGVLIAREIIRLHNGSIHSGPGMEYTEVLISLRQW